MFIVAILLLSALSSFPAEAAKKKKCFPLPPGWGGIHLSAKIVVADGKKVWRAIPQKESRNRAEFYRSCHKANCSDATIAGFICKGFLGAQPK
jgi:hypothetical protein